eukprot:TCONS_00052182-protein
MRKQCFCYVILPTFSIIGILGISWLVAAFIEIFTNNLTMIRILDRNLLGNTHLSGEPVDSGNQRHQKAVGDTKDKLFWFVQVSDIHLSQYRNYNYQLSQFRMFCSNLLKRIGPELVIITGDLTDAKDQTMQGSEQYIKEWRTYNQLVKHCTKNIPKAKWLDVRGNHDSFNVPSLNKHWNLYEEYAASQQKFSSGLHHYIHQTKYGKYAFTGIDIAPNPGPGRPFNFFALPTEENMKAIEHYSSQSFKYNGTVWYGHYPLSITTKAHELRILLSSGIAYLCGHLHKFPLLPHMHAIHNEGLRELELSDWKYTRKFRLAAFDHDSFSFVDVTYPIETIVLFTNPVDARYMVQGKTPLHQIKSSTHIRFLLFASQDIDSMKVRVFIDDEILCKETNRQGPLNTCSWNPSKYQYRIHKIQVVIENGKGIEEYSMEFSLDGTRIPLGIRSVILILTDLCTMLRALFVLTVILVVVIPIVLKTKATTNKSIGICQGFLQQYAPYVHNVINRDVIFWKIIWYNVYIALGPHCIGFFVPNSLGMQFAYGIWTNGTFLPGTLTFFYTSINILVFNGLSVISIGQILHTKKNLFTWKRNKRVIVLSLLLIYCFYKTFMMYWIAYGWLAAFTNVSGFYTVPFYMYLLQKATNYN